jgi:hypothetical protein
VQCSDASSFDDAQINDDTFHLDARLLDDDDDDVPTHTLFPPFPKCAFATLTVLQIFLQGLPHSDQSHPC